MLRCMMRWALSMPKAGVDARGGRIHAALRLDPELATAHLHLGLVLLSQQQMDAALSELATAVQLAPKSAMAQLTLGKALAQAGKWKTRSPSSRLPWLSTPPTRTRKYQLALAYQANGQFKEALPLFQEVAKHGPGKCTLADQPRARLVQLGNAKDAIPIFQRALSLTPDVVTIYEDLGVAYLQESDVDDALREFRPAFKLDPSAPQLHYNLGLALKLKDDLSGAIPELETAAQTRSQRTGPALYPGHPVHAARALRGCRPATGDGPETAPGKQRWVGGARLRLPANKTNCRRRHRRCRKRFALHPKCPGPHITLASVLAEQGKQPEAAAERKTAADLTRVAVNHQRATFATNTGNMLLEKGQIADAIARYQEALADDPNFAEAHRQLAVALAREGRTAEANIERKKADDLELPQP